MIQKFIQHLKFSVGVLSDKIQNFGYPKFVHFIFIFVFIGISLHAQYDAVRFPIIPKPYKLLPYSGNFSLNENTVILTDNKNYRKEIEYFRQQVKSIYGLDLKYGKGKYSSNFIYISEDSLDIPNEGYDLFINKNEINIYGGHAGIFYALQSLFQLIPVGDNSIKYDKDSNIVSIPGPRYVIQYNIPTCSIVDQPRFPWRGMHLDVARHFFSKNDVKNYLRYMALYKMNTFHWHLTDDQGWRIEIKKYPKLTSVGGFRNGTLIGHEGAAIPKYDSILYGGFYTQDDIREIVKFADSLHITIVPEIEMPGHSLAMLAAYPDLGCTPGPFSVCRTWGVFEDVLCPTEHTFTFLDDVLKEVCALFPGKYIHIGGDECPKSRWKESAFCQDLMKKNNLKDENELQSWFTKRIVKMLQEKGKQAIGWDEILEGAPIAIGIAEGAAIMSWRGEEGGIAAAKAKHKAVMCPGEFCYFDHYQSQNANEPLAFGGFLPIEKVYSYNPVPNSLNAEERKYIMGVQANLWTEYIPDFKQVQYMLFPRMAALAEVAWDETNNKDYDFFMKRLVVHLNLIERLHVNYAKSIYDIHSTLYSTADGLFLKLESFKKDATIRYTEGSYYNQKSSKEYTGPIKIYNSTTITAVVLKSEVQLGQVYHVSLSVNKTTGKPITLRKAPSSSYNHGGATTLIDGQTGRMPWVGSDWLGWSGDTLDATIDLMRVTDISEINISTLFDANAWIYQPGNFRIMVSNDGVNYSNPKQLIEPDDGSNDNNRWHTFKMTGVEARYVRIIVSGMTKIPMGSPGEGNAPWLFVDEIQIR